MFTRLSKPALVVGAIVLVAGATVVAILTPTSGFLGRYVDGNTVAGLVCTSNRHNFGPVTMKEASEREHTFVLVNTSDHPIKIVRQGSTCGCTVAEIPDGTVVAPGAEIKVPIKADWGGRPGAQSAVVTIVTDDERTPLIDLEVSGFVKSPVIVAPDFINFGLLKPGEQATRIVALHPGTDPRPFRLTAIENPSAHISIRRLPGSEETAQGAELPLEGGPGKFAVQVTGPRTTAREESRIVFRTDLDDRPEVPLLVRARFEGALVAMPQSIFLTAKSGEDVVYREVRIRSSQNGTGFEPEAKIVWKSDSANRFFIEGIAGSGDLAEREAVVTVGFNCKDAKGAMSRAVLRIDCEGDFLDVPIIAMGR